MNFLSDLVKLQDDKQKSCLLMWQFFSLASLKMFV